MPTSRPQPLPLSPVWQSYDAPNAPPKGPMLSPMPEEMKDAKREEHNWSLWAVAIGTIIALLILWAVVF